MDWKIEEKKTVLEAKVFTIEELKVNRGAKAATADRLWYRMDCVDWVNVLPITIDNRALLIRQPRVGSFTSVLETPGGMLDQGEERDPMLAAVRELEEETGFTSQRVLPLGNFFANPALQTNRCHFFLALGCQPNPNRQHFPDANEEISPHLVPVDELGDLVKYGRIDHAFAALCIQLAMPFLAATKDSSD